MMETNATTRAAVTAYMNIRNCAEERPEGTYQAAQDIVDLVESVMDFYESEARALGLKQYEAHDCALNMAAMIYQTLSAANPLATPHLEGFGEHVGVIPGVRERAERNRDQLRELGLT
jgi:hypothetical protein